MISPLKYRTIIYPRISWKEVNKSSIDLTCTNRKGSSEIIKAACSPFNLPQKKEGVSEHKTPSGKQDKYRFISQI